MHNPLPRSFPEPMGVEPAAVTRFIDAIEQAKLELHSFMMLRHGSVVAEGWWKPYEPELPHMLFSLSKSFTSTAVGFAVAEGLLSVDDPVLSFFPDEKPSKPGRYWEEMKVRHLLSMSTGHTADTTRFMINRKDGDWVKGFLNRPVCRKPGTHFLYNTGATYMLSVIVQKLTGQRVLDYLTPRLFKPLGIGGAEWEQCPKGYDTGGFGLKLKTEDIAKFGQFLLQKGQWQGKQLLPAAWVGEATGKQVGNGPADGTNDWGEGYGYQFWRCTPGCYRGDGAFGQYCVVIPEKDAVVAMTGGLGDMGAVLRLLWNVLPAMGEPLPDEPGARRAMAERLESLQYDPPALGACSPLEDTISGSVWKLGKNREKFKSVSFAFEEGACRVTYTIKGNAVTLLCGRNRWAECSIAARPTHGDRPEIHTAAAASFGWQHENTLVLTVRDVHAPFVTTHRVKFTGDELELLSSQNVSFGPTEMPPVTGIKL